MMVPVKCCMMVSVRKVRHDGVCLEGPAWWYLLGRSCMMVSVRKVLHDGICLEGPA